MKIIIEIDDSMCICTGEPFISYGDREIAEAMNITPIQAHILTDMWEGCLDRAIDKQYKEVL